MCVVLPDARDGLWSLWDKIASGDGGSFLREHLPEKRVKVGRFQVPKLKMSFSTSVRRALRDLGVEAVFSARAELLDMLENDGSGEPLFLTDVVHKAVIDVNEQGTKAAAATACFMFGCCFSQERPVLVDFVADHPFAFFVLDEISGTILFAGHVLDPTCSPQA
jgi:serpin B